MSNYKMIVLYIAFIFIGSSFLHDLEDPPDIFEAEFALRILSRRHLDHKTFCIFSNESHTTDDLRDLNQVITDIMDQDFGFNFQFDEEDSRKFVTSYFKFIHNEETYMKILVELIIPDECQFTITNKNDLPELIINKLISNLDNLTVDSSPELLALACQSEVLLKDLSIYSGSENKKEQELSDVMVFNDAMKKAALNSSDERKWCLLVQLTHEFMGKELKPIEIPSKFVILCLVVKSIKSYEKHTLETIRMSYEIIVTGLKQDEMCELSTLNEDRLKRIDDNLKIVNGTKLSKFQRDYLLRGFEYFFMSMLDTFSEIDLRLYVTNYQYMSNQCRFNRELLLSEYDIFITKVLKYWNNGLKISNFGEMVTIFCIYSNMRNYKEINGNPSFINALPRIIGSYFSMIYILNNNIQYDSYFEIIIKSIQIDSEYGDLYLKNSYRNRLNFECKLRRFRYNKTNVYEYSKLIHPFLYDYAYIYCSTKKSDPKLFADRLSVGLIGVRDDNITSFKRLQLFVNDFLDTSADDITITDLDVFEFSTDRCYIRAINYNSIEYKKTLFNKPDHESISKTIIPMCSLFKSVSKVGSDYNNPVSTTIWMVILDSSINLMKNNTFNNLKFDEKFKTLKNYVNDKLKLHSLTQGTSMRIECEIRMILNNGLPEINSELLQDLYIHLSTKYPNKKCQLITSMFGKRTYKLISHLKQYPNLKNLDNTKINAYLLYINKSLPYIIKNLTSYTYPEVLTQQLIDNTSCDYHKTNIESNLIIRAYNINLYKNTKKIWMNNVVYHTCLLSRDTNIYKTNLDEHKKLSLHEMNDLKNQYTETLSKHPDLHEINEQNYIKFSNIITNNKEFKLYKYNPLKSIIANCYMRKLYYTTNYESITTQILLTSTKSPSKSDLSLGAIISISFACSLFVIFVIITTIYFYKNQKYKNFTTNNTIKYII